MAKKIPGDEGVLILSIAPPSLISLIISMTVMLSFLYGLIGCVGGKKANEKIRLQLNLQRGKSYSYRTTIEEKKSQIIQGKKQDMTEMTIMEYSYSVEEVDPDGIASVNLIHHSIFYKQDGPMGKIEYDSSNPPVRIPPLAIGFAALLDRNFLIRISRDGLVVEIQGVEEMIKYIMEQSDSQDMDAKASMEESLRKQFGNQYLREMMEGELAFYPSRSVSIGESWSKKTTMTRGLPVIIDGTFRLKSCKDGIVVIKEHSRIRTDPVADPVELLGMKLRYDMSGDRRGTLKIDEATGLHLYSKWTQESSGRVQVEGLSQIRKGTSWPISTKSTVTHECID